MVLTQLRSIYEKRRKILQNILHSDSRLEKSRREQITGAITEIDALLKTIDTLREEEIMDNQNLDDKGLGIQSSGKSINLVQKIGEKLKVNFSESKTKDNLINIFVRKCETAIKYEIFSEIANKEEQFEISRIFQELSMHEKEHARTIYRHLGWERRTYDNIKEAADIEQHYHAKIHDEFEKIALDERFADVASLFKHFAQIEGEQEKRLLKLLKGFNDRKLFRKDSIVKWKCMGCGHVAEGKEPPKACPVCKRPQTGFAMMNE